MVTKIEAVNRILVHIQLRPVQSLEEPLDPVVAQAKLVLEQEARTLQQKGWEFNREDEREFSPDVDGNITLPTTVLAVDLDGRDRANNRVAVRGRRLYNAADRTYVWTESKKLNVVVEVDFDDLSSAAQEVALWRTCREIYITAGKNDRNQLASIAQKESEAYAELVRQDILDMDPFVGDSPLVAKTIMRRDRWVWVT